MASNVALFRFRLRGDTAANWTSVNPTLAADEPGIEQDTRKWKVGDGTTAWNALAYMQGSGSSGSVTYSDVIGLDERIRDVMNTAIVQGTNMTITKDDAGDTITFAAAGGGGGGGSVAWADITSPPAFIGAGTTAVLARAAIGATDLVIGTTSTTAKAGNYAPAAANISDATAIGRGVLTAADAPAIRALIGAGTSALILGTTTGTAKDGAYQPAAVNISDSTAVGRSLLTAGTTAIARAAIGAGTSDLVIGTTLTTAKAGNYAPTAAGISDATTIGRTILTAVDAPAVRTAIGAGVPVDTTLLVTKAGGPVQFANWSTTAVSDEDVMVYDTTTAKWQPTDLTLKYARVDSGGRLDVTSWQKYFVPMVVLTEDQDVPSDFPLGGIVFERPTPPSITPLFRGGAFNATAGTTVAVTTNADIEVGEWIGIAVMTSGETTSGTLPTTFVSTTPAAGAWTITEGATNYQSGTVQENMRYAKVTTRIPSGTVVTLTLNQSRVHKAMILFKMQGLVTSAPVDQSAVFANGSSTTLAQTVGPTSATTVANEVAIMVIGHNDSTGAITRPIVGTNGWLLLGSQESDNGSSSRSLTVLYKILNTTGAVTGTFSVNASDGNTGAWAGSVSTFKAA